MYRQRILLVRATTLTVLEAFAQSFSIPEVQWLNLPELLSSVPHTRLEEQSLQSALVMLRNGRIWQIRRLHLLKIKVKEIVTYFYKNTDYTAVQYLFNRHETDYLIKALIKDNFND